MRQPDDRSWEEEFIHNQNNEIEKLSEIIKVKSSRINELECRLKYIINNESMADDSINKDVLRIILK